MVRVSTFIAFVLVAGFVFGQDKVEIAPPLTEAEITELTKSFQKLLGGASARIEKSPESLDGYSQRGDAYFFLGRFKEAVSDYDKLNEFDPEHSASNWRRGIALFYAGRSEDATAQFDSYHSFDQVDNENGIWRYLSQHKSIGREKAREKLFKYKKDDREPFPSVYKLFAGTMTPDDILNGITKADLTKSDRESRLFYAHLYIGLNYAVEEDSAKAQQHLAAATKNPWPKAASYGPNYMWHVARLHEELLRKKLARR